MTAKDTEAAYSSAPRAAQLIGEIVGSPALGPQVVSSILRPDEHPTEKNIQFRLRESLGSGSIQVKGLGPKGLKRLQSALALGQLLYTSAAVAGALVNEPAIAAQAFGEIAWEPVEKFAVLALDVKHRILSMRVIASGTATEVCAHPREIFRWIIQVGGSRCIIGHNHPSGSVEPSDDDLQLTKQLIDAGKLLDIPLLDHLVVSGDGYVSIRETSGLWVASDS